MFCYNCGKQIDDDSTFCPYCGSNVKEGEETKETPKVQEPIKQDINNTQPITNPTPKKQIPIPLIAAAGAIGLIILITVGYFLINMGSINALDGAEMTFEGYNNYGTFDVTFNTENNKSYEKLQEKLYTYQEELLDTCFIDKSSKKCENLAEKAYYLEKALSSTNYSYSVSGDKPTDELSNGDTVTMTIEYDKELFKKAGIKISGTTKKFKVKGLKEPETIDLLPYLDVEWASSGGDYYLVAKVSSDSPLEDIPCDISDPDESGNATIVINEKELARYGYIQKGGDTTKIINVGQRPQRIDSINDSNKDEIIDLVFDVLEDKYLSKCGWNLYTDKGEELIYGSDKKDITNLSVSYGTIYATINIHTEKGNTYKKSISFEAYIDQNGKYVCATQFDSDSIGCGTIGKNWPEHD